MLIRQIIAAGALALLFSIAAFGTPPKTGCNKFNFTGAFLAPNASDALGNGDVHNFAFQLSIHSDGTVDQYWTGIPDYMINTGTGSPASGSWTCRNDGKLVITWIQASYLPVTPAQEPLLTAPDVKLLRHFRTTYLFSVDDDNTVTRIQSRTRSYTPAQDPTDAAGGTLGVLNTTAVQYKRLVATDSDLTAP